MSGARRFCGGNFRAFFLFVGGEEKLCERLTRQLTSGNVGAGGEVVVLEVRGQSRVAIKVYAVTMAQFV